MGLERQITLFNDGVSISRTRRQPDKSSAVESNVPSPSDLEPYLLQTKAQLVPAAVRHSLLSETSKDYPILFYRGDLSLLEQRVISVVGTRNPSPTGIDNARRVTKLLGELGYIVLSGLAKGVDTVAHKVSLDSNGKTIAVLGTPIHKIYPAENKTLAEEIASRGLLMSCSLPHEEKGQYLFPRRNRLMALLSKATIIIEAGPTSGVVHQAAECLRQSRTLILLKPLVEQSLPWVPGFIKSGAKVAEKLGDVRNLLE
jgi:DNA processing protein